MLGEVQVLGRLSPSGADYVRQPVVLAFPPALHSVVEARAALEQLADQWSCAGEVLEDARIVLSELMSNGVLHARTELQVGVGLLTGGALRIEVHDGSAVPPLAPPEAHDEGSNLLDESGESEV
ncbi:MAG TPA: ATP-binding protein, partial [Acidimicrobiales bacterium]|nr:ATP-binding protein [Acidimicrobiales bacterium]